MWTSLRTAVSGMLAQQRALDVAADNLSKLNVPGARAHRVSFSEMMPEVTYLGVPDGEGNVQIDARETGKGVRATAILQDLSQGEFMPTDNPLDIAVDGNGLLTVTLPDGRTGYTRGASLQIDGLSRLVTGSGTVVSPLITVPQGTAELQVKPNGDVIARSPDGNLQTIGQLKLVRFENPEGLQSAGGNALLPTVSSGAPIAGAAGEPGIGTVVSNVVESSNIDSREEYVRIVQTQRAYQLNVRALTTMDEMLQDASNLRRS